MRRALRILRKTLFAASLVLSLLLVGLWVRSMTHWDLLTVRAGRVSVTVNTVPDLLNVGVTRRLGPPGTFEWRYVPSEIGAAPVGRNWRRFTWSAVNGSEWDAERQAGYPVAGDAVSIPIWSLILLLCLPLLLRLARSAHGRWQRCRRPPDTCPTCGYDLRATPSRCPECGNCVTMNPAAGPVTEETA